MGYLIIALVTFHRTLTTKINFFFKLFFLPVAVGIAFILWYDEENLILLRLLSIYIEKRKWGYYARKQRRMGLKSRVYISIRWVRNRNWRDLETALCGCNCRRWRIFSYCF